MKIGIYGGTFDPPHLGHMEAARTALEQMNLDRLIIIPDCEPPHKTWPRRRPRPSRGWRWPPSWPMAWAPGRRSRTWRSAGRERATPPTRWRPSMRPFQRMSCGCSWERTCSSPCKTGISLSGFSSMPAWRPSPAVRKIPRRSLRSRVST